jgi:signal transduction histidine kinase
VLENLFSHRDSGVDCVLETESLVYTYLVTNGKPELKGAGRLHDPAYESYGKSIDLFSEELFTHTSAHYTLTVYPNDDLFYVFGTDNPTRALAGTLCIMLITSILFIVYDHFVQKELYRKKAITEARRLFVRFISHAIRSPLHSICMGTEILQTTLSQFTSHVDSKRGVASPTTAKEKEETSSLQENLRDWSDLASDVMINANCAVNVLSDLIVSYEKVKSDSLPLELSVIPVCALIERSVKEFHLPLVAKKIELEVERSDTKPTQGIQTSMTATLNEDC